MNIRETKLKRLLLSFFTVGKTLVNELTAVSLVSIPYLHQTLT